MKKLNHVLCAAAVLLILSILCSCSVPTFSSQSMENPKNTLEEFISLLQSRQFDDAMELVGNYSSFDLEQYDSLEEGSCERIISDYILDSYMLGFLTETREKVHTGYTSEDISVNGREATITFEFRSFDFELFSVDLESLVSEEGAARTFRGEVYENEEEVLALVDEVFYSNFSKDSNVEKYYKTDIYELTAVYESGNWLLHIPEDFYGALVGR